MTISNRLMNDEEALKLAREGRQEGYRALYDRYAGYLYRVALSFLRHPAAAEDALQEAFTAAFRSLQQFRGESRLKTWLYRILYHQVLKGLQRHKAETPVEDLDQQQGSGEADVRNVESKLEVEAVLKRLSERDRSLLLMAYWDDLTCREIAEIMEIQENHVKILLYRARKAFADRWGHDPEQGANHAM